MSLTVLSGSQRRPRMFYSVWTDALERAGQHMQRGIHTVTVFIQLAPFRTSTPLEPAGRIRAIIRRGVIHGSDSEAMWISYGERCCKAWHALREVCDLAGLDYRCPPGLVADAAAELDRFELERTIRELYDLPGREGGQTGMAPWVPELPPDDGPAIEVTVRKVVGE